ncbi:MAG: HEAT repeat domain-containing protein [Deltaproteobacteria bacterium]
MRGELGALQAEVAHAESKGELGRSSVRSLAGAVLDRELSSLREPVQDFPELSACARGVRGTLADVARGSDEPAAFASLALLDAGLEAPRHDGKQGSEPALLPVRARRALGIRNGAQRRALMLHGDADVRRAALEAAAHSLDPRDLPSLFEVARLDPDARTRALALRTLGGIGGEAVVVGLADLWATESPEQRLEIVRAWSLPASYAMGGEAQLVRIVELSAGSASVAAALALVRERGASSGLAITWLARALHGTDASARLWALYEVPWSNPELQALVIEAQKSEDAPTRLVALLRQVEQGTLDGPARDALRALALSDKPVVGLVARVTLARAGDASVKPALIVDLKAPRARDRMLAAFALVQLDEWAAAAHALADDSPRVRQTVACQMLAEPRSASSALEQSRAEAFGPLAPQLPELLVSAEQSGTRG